MDCNVVAALANEWNGFAFFKTKSHVSKIDNWVNLVFDATLRAKILHEYECVSWVKYAMCWQYGMKILDYEACFELDH